MEYDVEIRKELAKLENSIIHEIAGHCQRSVAEGYVQLVRKLGDRSKDDYITGYADYLQGYVLMASREYYEAIGYLNKSLRAFYMAEENDKLAYALARLGQCFKAIGKPEDALEYCLQSMSLLSENCDAKMECTNLLVIGSIFQETGVHDRAIYYFKKGLDCIEHSGLEKSSAHTVALLNLNISFSYLLMDKYEKTEKYLKIVLERYPEWAKREEPELIINFIKIMLQYVNNDGKVDEKLMDELVNGALKYDRAIDNIQFFEEFSKLFFNVGREDIFLKYACFMDQKTEAAKQYELRSCVLKYLAEYSKRTGNEEGYREYAVKKYENDALMIKNTAKYKEDHVRDVEKINENGIMSQAIKSSYQANKAKLSFLSNISHELITPLNALSGMSEILKEEVHSERSLHYVESIREAALNLLDKTNDILTYSQIEAESYETFNREYDVRTFVDSLINKTQSRMSGESVELISEVSEHIPQMLIGDVNSIEQIYMNLVSNAIKFTSEGHIKVTFGWKNIDVCHNKVIMQDFDYDERKYGMLEIKVEDTGIGIHEDDIKDIFTAFEQADLKKSRLKEGTGLGLSICKGIAEILGGDIKVESVYRKGSTFTAEVPQQISESAFKSHKNLNGDIDLSGLNILIVDDNKMNLEIASIVLKNFGCSTICVTSGNDAIDTIRAEKHIDAVLMDYMMPQLDGIQTTTIIRKERTQEELPIIALTADTTSRSTKNFLAAGMNDVVYKPLNPKELYSKLQLAFEAH